MSVVTSGSILYEIEPTSPITYANATLIRLAVAGLASYLPARRATRADPRVAFTEEQKRSLHVRTITTE